MSHLRVLIADDNILIREGLKALLKENQDVSVIAEVSNSKELLEKIPVSHPDLIIIDYCAASFKVEDIPAMIRRLPGIRILAITDMHEKEVIVNALRAGVSGHILKDCPKPEILDAVYSTAGGDQFFCGKVLDAIKDETDHDTIVPCDPVKISERELEIIKLIAEGLTNKEIADLLFISTHTVMTHRKNIMNKLGINNTAGIVIYAIKEQIISPNKYLFSPPAVN